MFNRDDGKPKTSFDSDYLVEWYVENDLRRYSALAKTSTHVIKKEVPITHEDRADPKRYGLPTGNYKTIEEPTHAVVCCVLEVPLPKLEAVTSSMRNSTRVRATAPYLMKAAEFAATAGAVYDRMAQLELENKKLKELVLDHAHMLDSYDKNISVMESHLDEALRHRIEPRVPGLWAGTLEGIGKRWTARAKYQIRVGADEAATELRRVRAAIDEKRSDVAAALLREMPDGDW